VRLSGVALEDHVAHVIELMERLGAVLEAAEDTCIHELPNGVRWYALEASLPGADAAGASTLVVRERWHRVAGDLFERTEYEYELRDHQRDFRRAFHLHDPDWFVDRHQVVVHEHCERPIGVAPCAHIEGSPVRDAFAGVMRLIGIWTDPELPECAALPCLDRQPPIPRR